MNNHAYQYSCSPDTEPEHQAIIANKKTEPLEQGCMQYKYDFPEFEGPAGLDLLRKTINAILPGSLARTWEIVRRWEKPDQDPYVGTERISEKAQRGLRVIQLDLQRLEEMGLMRTYTDLVTSDSGQVYSARFKDFSNLYRLAHEYHEFTQTIEYKRYQPTWQDADELKAKCEADPEFKKFLLRFENYRKVILHSKPGRKKVHKEELRFYEDGESLGGPQKDNGHFLPKTKRYFNDSSPYIETLNSNYLASIEDSNMTQENFSITQDSPLTRSEDRYPHDERGTHESEDFTMESSEGNRKQDPVSFADQDRNNPQPEAEPKVSRNVPRVAKELSPQQKGKELIEAVLNEEDRKSHTPKQERRNKWLESEELRKEHKGIVNLYSHIADRLNDQNPKSTATLLAKMQKEIGMSDEEFIKHIDYARQKVCSIPQDKIRKRGADGKPNRTPLFIQVLKDALKRGIAACQEDDRRADDVRSMFRVVEQEKAQVAQELDVRDQTIDEAENDQEVWTELEREITTSHQIREEIMAEASAVEPKQVQYATVTQVNQWAEDDYKKSCDQAKEMIGQLVLKPVTLQVTRLLPCGCPMAVRKGLRGLECVTHQPQPEWSDITSSKIKQIVGDLPTLERCRDLVIEECQGAGWQIVGEAV